MTNQMDYRDDAPKSDEDDIRYAARLQKDGHREIYVRKALRAHFGLSIEETIKACGSLPKSREREILALRQRFPDLNENRFAWKISKTLTIPKDDALTWSQTILAAEGQG